MASVFQDSEREQEAIKLFGLERDESQGRSGVDAYLRIGTKRLSFELKTASRGSVTTVRDFGPDHVKKWKNLHWLIGFYKQGSIDYFVYFVYGSPSAMEPWIREKWLYIEPDFRAAEMVPQLVGPKELSSLLGARSKYTRADAERLQKRQYSAAEYTSKMDLPSGYTATRMLEILRERVKYLMLRGSTLNNPHIPAAYFDGWEQIRSNYAKRLRDLVTAQSK